MRVFYDTEFIENGTTIDLVSIGMVAEDGRELYLISSEFSISALQANPWLMDNVAPTLPLKPASEGGPWDAEHPDFTLVTSRSGIARRVEDFLLGTDHRETRMLPHIELWAWYAAYDHVALAQLFGRMIDLPEGVPMWTNDLRQECERLGNPTLPEQPDGVHNALADARHNLVRAQYLDQIAAGSAR